MINLENLLRGWESSEKFRDARGGSKGDGERSSFIIAEQFRNIKSTDSSPIAKYVRLIVL